MSVRLQRENTVTESACDTHASDASDRERRGDCFSEARCERGRSLTLERERERAHVGARGANSYIKYFQILTRLVGYPSLFLAPLGPECFFDI